MTITLLYRRNEHNIVNQLYFNKIKKKHIIWISLEVPDPAFRPQTSGPGRGM